MSLCLATSTLSCDRVHISRGSSCRKFEEMSRCCKLANEEIEGGRVVS